MSGRVTTFYSFKGGVGRTQCLANVAVALARRGRTVVVCDMDLESPGLHTYFEPPGEPRRLRDEDLHVGGVLEWVTACLDYPSEPPRLSPIEVAHPHTRGFGKILLIPAGKLDSSYPERLAAFSWDRFYEVHEGFRYIEMLREQLLELGEHVLVDSRTGFTDVSNVCTFQLPDTVLLLFVPHQQGIDGVARMANAITLRREEMPAFDRARDLWLVPTKVDPQGPEKERRYWFEEMRRRFDRPSLQLFGPNELVEYSSAAAWGETIVDPDDETSRVAQSYRGIAERLDRVVSVSSTLPWTSRQIDEADSLDNLSAALSELTEARRELDDGVGALTDLRVHANRVHLLHESLWRRARRVAREVQEVARAIEQGDSWIDSIREPTSLSSWRDLLAELGARSAPIAQLWREGISRRLRAAVDDPIVDDKLDAMRDDLLRWRRDAVEEQTRVALASLPMELASRRLDLGTLTVADVERLPLEDRDPWLLAQTQRWLDAEWEDARLRLRQLLELTAALSAPAQAHWTAFDLLLLDERDRERLHELGVSLWVVAWGRLVSRRDDVATQIDIGPEARRWYEEPAWLDNALRDRIRRAVADPIRPRQLTTHANDPILRAALRAVGPLDSSPVHAVAAAHVLRERLRGGLTLDRGVSDALLLGFVERGWDLEAFELLRGMRDAGEDSSPTPTAATVVSRCVMRHIANRDEAAALGLLSDEDVWRWSEAGEAGRLTLSFLVSGALELSGETAHLRARTKPWWPRLPETLREPLEALDRWADTLVDLDRALALWEDARRLQRPANFYGSWQRSAELLREFEQQWTRRLDALEADQRPFDLVSQELARLDADRELRGFVKKLGAQRPEGDVGPAFASAYDTVRKATLVALEARPRGWTIRRLLDLRDLRARMRAAFVAQLAVHRELSDVVELLRKAPQGGSQPVVRAVHQVDPRLWKTFGSGNLARPRCCNLIAVFLDERSLKDACDDALRASAFDSLRELLQGAEEGERSGWEQRAAERWQEEIAPLISRVDAWARRLEDLRRDRIDVADARRLFEEFEGMVRGLPAAGSPLTQLTLREIGDARVSQLRELAEYVEIALAECEERQRRHLEEAREQRKALRRRFDERYEDLLTTRHRSVEDQEHGERVAGAFGRALVRDLSAAETLLSAFENWLTGGPIPPLPDDERPKVPRLLPAPEENEEPGPPGLRQVFPARVHAALTEAASHLPHEFNPGEEALRLALEEFQGDRLRGLAASIARSARDADRAGAAVDVNKLRGEARGAFLIAWGRVMLSRADGFDAAVFFIEGIRWASAARSIPLATQSVSACAWGVLLALMLPHLSEDERSRVRSETNLAALLRRPIGLLPLAHIDHLALWDDVAEVAVELGGSGAHFVELLLPHLKARPLAATAFFGALAGRLRPRADDASLRFVEWVARTFEEPTANLTPPTYRRRQELLRSTRLLVEQRFAETDLGQAVLASIEHALKTDNDTSSAICSLVTDSVPLDPAAHIALRLTRPSTPSLLRVEVSVSFDQGEAALSRVPSALVGTVAETPREALLRVASDASAGPLEVRCEVTRRTLDGARVEVPTARGNFSVLITPAPKAPPPPNPYMVKLPVKGARIFGRDDELRRLKAGLVGATQDNAVMIYGPRRIGKTTLINALRHDEEVTRRYQVFIADLDYVTAAMPAWRFYYTHLMEPLRHRLTPLHILVQLPPEERMRLNPHQAFREFLELVDRRLVAVNQRLLVVLDELDRLVVRFPAHRPTDGDEPIGEEVLACLRSVMQRSERVSFILAGAEEYLLPRLRAHDSRLFQLTVNVRLSALSDRDARDLVREPVRDVLEYAPDAVDRILDASAKQPWLIQMVCSHLFNQVVARRATKATLSDAMTAVRETLERETFLHLEEVLPEPLRPVVVAVASAQRGSNWVFLRDVERALRLQGRPRPPDELQKHLRQIAEELPYVLQRHESLAGRYRITLPLYAVHLRRQLESPWLPVVRG